jgi:hypothetical protein
MPTTTTVFDPKKISKVYEELLKNLAERTDDRLVEVAEEMVQEIDRRARQYCVDNMSDPKLSDFLFVRGAMLIGASVILERK